MSYNIQKGKNKSKPQNKTSKPAKKTENPNVNERNGTISFNSHSSSFFLCFFCSFFCVSFSDVKHCIFVCHKIIQVLN